MRYLFAIITAIFLTGALAAQEHAKVNVNFDKQPVWGPEGNDYVENYYMPDIEAYYNVPQHRFYYNERGRWVGRSSLPSRFGKVDLYNSHKVVMNEKDPWKNHSTYKDKYASYKGQHDQQSIRDARDPKYYVNPNHPEHNNWVKQQKHDNGNGKGKGNSKDKGNDHDNR